MCVCVCVCVCVFVSLVFLLFASLFHDSCSGLWNVLWVFFFFFYDPQILCFHHVPPQLTCLIVGTGTLAVLSALCFFFFLFAPSPHYSCHSWSTFSNIPHTCWHISSWFAPVSIELSDSISSPALPSACKCAFVLVQKGSVCALVNTQ